MEFNKLQEKITDLSESSGKTKEEITQALADFAETKFGSILTEDEEAIIKEIQEKLIERYYQMPDHTQVTKRPDYKNDFGLDDLEMDYAERAGNELGDLGILEGNENYTKLTKKGVLRAKKLLGHI
ncbi:MAG: hypothetical protein COA32_14895 [Fluviicola sp.]|nr:MAG: hypothetical protein COA32_14895 [Fluviicola sp.]